MTKTEDFIQSLVGLGQSIPRDARQSIFTEISSWYNNKQFYEATNKIMGEVNRPDVVKAVDLVKRSINGIEPHEATALLGYAAAFTNVLEDQLANQSRFNNRVEYVVTQPDYLMKMEQAAARSPLWGGSLFDAISQLIEQAHDSVDIINPYWSEDSVARLLGNLRHTDAYFRVLTLPGDANEPALELLAKIVSQAGGTITIYAPNREQIDATDAIAPIHAKLILCDNVKAYIGSANLSKGGLQNALEIGVIHQGPAIDQLVDYIEWVFECSEKWG